jgi:hypothetical protein
MRLASSSTTVHVPSSFCTMWVVRSKVTRRAGDRCRGRAIRRTFVHLIRLSRVSSSPNMDQNGRKYHPSVSGQRFIRSFSRVESGEVPRCALIGLHLDHITSTTAR